MYRSTKGASKARRDQINAEIRALKDLLPVAEADKLRLSYLHVMSLACIYTRKGVFFAQGGYRGVYRGSREGAGATGKGCGDSREGAGRTGEGWGDRARCCGEPGSDAVRGAEAGASRALSG